MRTNINRLAQKLGERMPKLAQELRDAGIKEGVVEYLSESIMLAAASALMAFGASALAFILNNKPNPSLSVALAVFAFLFAFAVRILRPSQLMRSRAWRIERSLVFSLHAMNIEMKSGIRFANAINDIAASDYGEFSLEMGRVIEEAQKYGLKAALENSARRNPSKIYRRVIWQLVNSLETGSDLRANLESVIVDLKRKQEDEAARYGRSMEKQMALYVMGGIVFPALSVVIVQTVSTLGLSGSIGGQRTYWSILLISLAVQAMFIYLIKFRKPTLLGESLIRVEQARNPLEHFKQTLGFAGVDKPWREYLISAAVLSISSGILLTLLLEPYTSLNPVAILAASTVLSAATVYAYLAFQSDIRGAKAAEYLPDSLRIMAASMEAGVAADQALLMSAKPEFGVLSREIQLMGADMIKNLTFEEALGRLKRRIKGESLHMSVNLISHGIKAGQGLAESLFQIAGILQDREHARQSVATQLHSVRTMVVILAVFSAPLLYGCSAVSAAILGHFNEKISSSLPPQVLSQSWIKPAEPQVGAGFIDGYIMVNLMATAFMGSIIAGELTSGRPLEGLRYALIMVLSSEILYLLIKSILLEKIGGAFI